MNLVAAGLFIMLAQGETTMAPPGWSETAKPAAAAATSPAEVREVRCPERLAATDCARLTSVVVSLAQTSVGRRKFRQLFGGATVDVDIREGAIEINASVPPERMAMVLDSPLRLAWDPQSATFQVTGTRLRAVFDALQEFLAGLAPELTAQKLGVFERGGLATLVLRSGPSHLQVAVDRAGKRMFLGAAGMWPKGPPPATATAASPPAALVAPPAAPVAPSSATIPPPAAPRSADEEARRQNPY